MALPVMLPALSAALPVAVGLGLALVAAPAQAQVDLTLLANGDEGEAVAQLQRRLQELGLFEGETTGFYGPLTEEAVIRFQTERGLLADGVAGPETLGALFSVAQPFSPVQTGLSEAQLRDVQTKLARFGLYLGNVDGLYGPQTEAALNSFQNIYGLPMTGQADATTLATLDRLYFQAQGQGSVSPAASPVAAVPAALPASTFTSQVNRMTVALPPAIASAPQLVANIPQTTIIASPLPPPLPALQPATSQQAFASQPPFSPPQQSFSSQPPNAVAAAPEATGYPYIVAVPIKTGATLGEVQQVMLNAFLAGSKRGTYIQAGAYTSREDAERATQILRDRRLDARVVYRPKLGN